jgi:predicted PurR-regulated permease PerM
MGETRQVVPPNDPPGEIPQPTTPVLSDSRRDANEAVTWSVRVAAAWIWRLLLIAAATYVLARALNRIGLVIFSVIIALFLTAVLQPLEQRLRRIVPGPKSLPPLLALLTGLAVLGGIGYFVEWQISTHITQLGDNVSALVTHTKHWLQTGPLHVKSTDLDKLSTKITDTIQAHQGQLISGAISTVRAVTEVIAGLLLVLLITFYLLRDGQDIWRWTVHLLPRTVHVNVDHAGRAGWRTVGGYMRGQLLIALFHGVSITIVLLVLRVPLAGALGVLIFLGSFIPLIGLTVTGALAVAVTLLEHGWVSALVVAIVIIVLVQAEAHLLQPFIMSRSVHIHPLAVVLAVSLGTILAGIAGALVAVPLVAFLNTTVHALRTGPVQLIDEPDLSLDEQHPSDPPN